MTALLACAFFWSLSSYSAGTMSAPTGLTATTVSSGEIDLHWVKNTTAETGYNIQRSLDPSSGFVRVGQVGPVSTYKDVGLAPSKIYYYRVHAYKTSGAKTTYSNFSNVASAETLIAAPSSISYAPLICVKNSSCAESASYAGGAPSSWNATLPPGLSIRSSNGAISGVPSAISANTAYQVIASNVSGQASFNLNIQVNDIAPSGLSYSLSSASYTVGMPIAADVPSSGGGTVVSYSVSPALPAGLSLNLANGIISGTPTAAASSASYTITATNSGGFVTSSVSIVVNNPLAVQGAIDSVSGGVINFVSTNCSGGGHFNAYTDSSTVYVPSGYVPHVGDIISATGPGTCATSIKPAMQVSFVSPPAPLGLSYSLSSATYTVGMQIAANTPTIGGGAVVSYSVSPALPLGLSLNATNGIISGTPSSAAASANYSVTATNLAGSASASILIAVNNPLTIQGAVNSISGNIINFKSTTCSSGYFDAYVNTSTAYVPSGYVPRVGDIITAKGPGTCATSINPAMQVSLVSSGTGPTHILSWDYGGQNYPASGLAFLSLVQDNYANYDYNLFHSHGVKMEFYADGNEVYNGGSDVAFFNAMGGIPESVSGTMNQKADTFYKDCAGNTLVDSGEGDFTWYIPDWSKSQTVGAYKTAFVGSLVAADYDFVMGDGGNPNFAGMVEAVASGTPATHVAGVPCDLTWAQYVAQTAAGMNQIQVPMVINGLGEPDYHSGMPNSQLDLAVLVAGSRAEQQYICPGGGCENQTPVTASVNGTSNGAGYAESVSIKLWQGHENTEIAMSNANKVELIEEYDANTDPSGSYGQAHRMFGTASFLLTYNPQYTYLFYGGNGFATSGTGLPNNPSGHRLYPEVEFVPLNPVVPEPANAVASGTSYSGGIDDLLSSGVFYREYKDCYLSGARVGSCVIAVNSNEKSPEPFSMSAYGSTCSSCHQLVLHNGNGASSPNCAVGTPAGQTCTGAEIFNGGTVTIDGPAPSPSMAPDTAVIVVNTKL